uniref:Histone acetyltransferase n=1 Tax=Panagrolaimus sp. JU765 TaxID=591449 RepID=A0AC34QUA6_9BILA
MLRRFTAIFNNSTSIPERTDLNHNCFRLSLTKEEKDYYMNCVDYSSKKKNVILVMREIICYGIGYEEYSKFTLDQRQRITRMIEHDVEDMIAKFKDCLENLRTAICNYILKFRYNMALVKWFNTASDDVKRYYFTNETGPYEDFLKSCRKLRQKNEILLDVQVLRLHLLKVFKSLTKLESAKVFMTLSAENQKRGKKIFDIFQINDKINNYEYKNWGEFQDDFLTMIEKFRPKIKKIEKEIIDIFEKDFAELIKPIAKLYGNCCGELLFYSKVRQFCYSNPDCRINPGDEYYCHDLPSINPNDLIAHYTLCKKCYKELPETGLNIASSSTDLEELIPKSSFQKLINYENIQEKFIFCYHCGRRWHAVCDLPVNEIDSYIEAAVNQHINREHPEFGHKDRISVRLVSNIEKQVD